MCINHKTGGSGSSWSSTSGGGGRPVSALGPLAGSGRGHTGSGRGHVVSGRGTSVGSQSNSASLSLATAGTSTDQQGEITPSPCILTSDWSLCYTYIIGDGYTSRFEENVLSILKGLTDTMQQMRSNPSVTQSEVEYTYAYMRST